MSEKRVYLVTYPEFIHAGLAPTRVKIFRELKEAKAFIRDLLKTGEILEEEIGLHECDPEKLRCIGRKF